MRRITYFLFILFAFTACKKDDDNKSSNNNNPPIPGVSYENPQLSGTTSSADFFGRITNQNRDNIEGALVEIGNKSTTTNAFGFYEINNASVDQDFAIIEVTAPTYFKQFRSFNPKEASVNMHDIKVIPQVFSGAFQSSTGGTVQLQGGGQVVFPVGDLVNSDGTAYTGQVAVATAYLNPTDPSLSSYMPGSLLAVDTDDELAVMITYGMAGVELYGSNGQLLQLGDNMTASLEMPIQPEQMAFAPESIPLWFFDETNGIWREDGIATKTGDKYIGDVSHFTFWNCDVPADYAYIEGIVSLDNTNYSLNSIYLKVVRPDGSSASSTINSDGTFSGFVPANEELQMFVVTSNCSEEFHYGDIPSISIGVTYDLGLIELSQIPELEEVTITASIVDCDGAPLSGLIVDIGFDGNQIYTLSDSDGQIDILLNCIDGNESGLSYTIINMDEALQSILEEIEFNPTGGNNYDLGELAYCQTEEVERFFTYSEGTYQTTMLNAYTVLGGNGTALSAEGLTNTLDFAIIQIITPTPPGIGPGEPQIGPWTGGHGLAFELDNGGSYSATFDVDEMEIYINNVEFVEPINAYVARIDATISGPVNVSIYASPNGGTPINEYTSTATCHFYYWPE